MGPEPGARPILVIDDDRELCEMLASYLGGQGFAVSAAFDGHSGLERAVAGGWDAVILDVMLPELDGVEVLRRLRTASDVPVVMLTARGDDVDRIVGLEVGADDYLPKPFNPRELVARLRAILRRTRGAGADETRLSVELGAGLLELDPATLSVRLGGRPVSVTATEFRVLERLVRDAGRIVEREELTRAALGRELTPFDRAIDTHISNLRRKLGRDRDGRSPIRSVRGAGYQLAPGG
jgi:two-component system response regulator CpxR